MHSEQRRRSSRELTRPTCTATATTQTNKRWACGRDVFRSAPIVEKPLPESPPERSKPTEHKTEWRHHSVWQAMAGPRWGCARKKACEHCGRWRQPRLGSESGQIGPSGPRRRRRPFWACEEVFARSLQTAFRSEHWSEHRTLNTCFPNTEQCSGPTLLLIDGIPAASTHKTGTKRRIPRRVQKRHTRT